MSNPPLGIFLATEYSPAPDMEKFPPEERGAPTLPPVPEPRGCLGARRVGALAGIGAVSSPCLTSLQLTLAAKSPPLLGALLCRSPSLPHLATTVTNFLLLARDWPVGIGLVGAGGRENPHAGSWESSSLPDFHWEGQGARGGSPSTSGRSFTTLFLGPVEICLF